MSKDILLNYKLLDGVFFLILRLLQKFLSLFEYRLVVIGCVSHKSALLIYPEVYREELCLQFRSIEGPKRGFLNQIQVLYTDVVKG